MELALWVKWWPKDRSAESDEPIVFARDVERDYSRVPTIGENVDLGEDWLLLIVTGVGWEHGGRVSLEFEAKEAEGLGADFPDELKAHGFYIASVDDLEGNGAWPGPGPRR